MSEEAIKRRMKRAKKAALKILGSPRGACEATLLSNHDFHILAEREKEIRKIRVVLDKITQEDEAAVRTAELPENFTREIWCRNINGTFVIKIIKTKSLSSP